ncbi:MAG TPA: hypothetical protein VNA89_11345 [Gemmatimonadaceae bacterium]|nr:hypothetical protein [Gemmatimonadaceae bacterium]
MPNPTRALRIAAAAALLPLTAACGESTNIRASLPVVSDTLRAWAVTGTPLELPSALDLGVGGVVRPDVAGTAPLFDILFDLDPAGAVLLIPARAAAGNLGGGQVGFILSELDFGAVTRAPNNGYRYDTTTVAPVGRTVIMETANRVCLGTLVPRLYAKLVVDSVRAAERTVFFRIVHDPNCGFRGLVPDEIPRS